MKGQTGKALLDLIRKAGPKGMLQRDLMNTFVDNGTYKNKASARVSINVSLLRMEKEGIVTKKQELNDGSGGILRNRWFAR